ncbi:MAG TPA: PEP-CTERM sorting domain-containing protein [Verrucomicrobiae bacterium]|jgi:hypothetical protein
MKSKLIHYVAILIAGVCIYGFNACATTINAPSTYANITIDGSFSDWASVPLAYSQPQLPADVVQYDQLYVANDANYLYIYFTLYTPAYPFTSSQNLFFDADTNYATGDHEHGIGSDMGVQSGVGFQQASGVFNTGGTINGLNYMMASNSLGTSYELRISLDATYNTGGAPVFTGDTVSIYLESSEAGGSEWFPNFSSSAPAGLTYTLAAAPVPEPSSFSLLAFGGGALAIIGIARRRRETMHEVRQKVSKRL